MYFSAIRPILSDRVTYVLFAFKEVPQASTGFSPFELMYGWRIRGPMTVLKETWESGKSQDASLVAHVMQIRE